jgi:hypothetical protein
MFLGGGVDIFPYMFSINVSYENYLEYEACLRWCIERFGEPDLAQHWYICDSMFLFNRLDYATEFKLRWV